MISAWLQSLMGRPTTAARRKLVIVGFNLANQWSHHYNELLGYREAAGTLGLVPHILVPRSAEPALATALSAAPVIDLVPPMADITTNNLVDQLIAFADTKKHLASLWDAIETHELKSADILLFPVSYPVVLAGLGEWLASRPRERRPSVFFRFKGGEMIDRASGHINYAAILYRLACSELRQQPGQERVFLLADSLPLASTLARFCCRRAFMMPLPMYFGSAASDETAASVPHVVYVHFNERSGRLIRELGNIMQLVTATKPAIGFTIKTSGLFSEERASLEAQCGSLGHVLPGEQDTAEYLENFSKCAIVLLPYESHAYTTGSSGVFIEATSFGKVVVVPAGTWMEQQLVAGCGAGTTFAEPRAEPVAAALMRAIAEFPRLSVRARECAPEVRKQNSCAQYIEQMMTLAGQVPDMEPICDLGDEIDFSNALESRCFIGVGWGETEDWGVWTIGRCAKLHFSFGSRQAVILRALVQPFLTPTHRRIDVRVSAARRKVARWTFSLDSPLGNSPQWREALIRRVDPDRPLDIFFAVDVPASPAAEGISSDGRTLGLGLRRLMFSSIS
jgi:hypothetical protein